MSIFAKKSLGQNFLHDKGAIRTIIDTALIKRDDLVLEIGPGEGALTEEILKNGGKVIAVEKDDRLIPILQKKFQMEIENGSLTLIHDDILEMPFEKLSEAGLKRNSYKLIANIPYYITGEILRIFLESAEYPSKIVFLVQKEVAERITDEKESILSISVKAYGIPKYIKTVKAGSFRPVPGVDSAILLIDNISKKSFEENNINEEQFFDIVKTGFSHKRKKLSSNLSEFIDKEVIKKAWQTLGLSENVRAEELAVDIWLNLTKELSR